MDEREDEAGIGTPTPAPPGVGRPVVLRPLVVLEFNEEPADTDVDAEAEADAETEADSVGESL